MNKTVKSIGIGAGVIAVAVGGMVAPSLLTSPTNEPEYLLTPYGEELTREEIQAELVVIDEQIITLVDAGRMAEADVLIERKEMLHALLR